MRALYDSNESVIYEVGTRCDGNMEGPFLIEPSDSYWNSPFKLAIVGQQTAGWSSHRDVSAQLAHYRKFDQARDFRTTPFWSFIRKLERALNIQPYSSIWLNLNRYDQDGERPTPSNETFLAELDYILADELKVLRPDVVVFLTGSHDDRIINLLDAVQTPITPHTLRELCGLHVPHAPWRAFRTYHPRFLRQHRIEVDVLTTLQRVILSAS